MIDALHEDLNQVIKKNYVSQRDFVAGESEDEFYRNLVTNYKAVNNSFVQDLFYGMFRSATTCPNEHLSLKYEPYNMLSVPIKVKGDQKASFSFYFLM